MVADIMNTYHIIFKGENMKKILSFMCSALIAGTAVFAVPVFAEDAKPAGLNPVDVKNALGMSIYLQGGYTYNANASGPGGSAGTNDLRGFDQPANSFELDMAEIVFSKDPAAGLIGYHVKFMAGETAKLMNAAGVGDAGPGATGSIDLTEAYLSYIAPVGKGLRFDAGKMVTFVGAEVIEAIDNPNYSRSLLFTWAEPLTHTGVKASYVFTDNVNAALFLLNGWDNATDNNSGKTVGVSVNIATGDLFSGYINYLQGPEQTNDNHDKRILLDLVATIKPIKPLSLILNYDNGQQDQSAGLGTQKSSGISGIVKYDINDTYSISVRGESFNDSDGYSTGTPQELAEFTLTPEIRLTGGLILRPEYRHDTSNIDSFDNGTKKTQDTFALAAMYRW
jgi:putative OmpL-like beta-barrel porin-2